MEQIIVDLLRSVNNVTFGSERDVVRKAFGRKYTEVKKNIFSQNTMDAYNDFHIYYDKTNHFEAIEIFGDVSVVVAGKIIFPGGLDNIKMVFPKIRLIDDICYTDIENSIGITVNLDDSSVIESILFGCEGYYLQ